MALTIKQENFVLAYLQSGNATAAYRAAFNAERMKVDTITATASELSSRHNIAIRLAELRKPVIAKAQLSLTKVLAENIKIAFFDARTLFDANGNIKPVADWSDAAAAVASIEITEGERRKIKIKLCDKNAAID